VVVQECNPSYFGDMGRRVTVPDQQTKTKSTRLYLKNNLKQKGKEEWIKS
jgi:hypothetical protein